MTESNAAVANPTMNATPEPVAAEACSYCGRPNPERLPVCSGCGTSLVEESAAALARPQGKNKALAVILALLFGPLGLLYVRALGATAVLLMVRVVCFVTNIGGLWLALGIHIVAALWAYSVAVELDEAPNARRDTKRLLEEAARLETVDRAKAIEVYVEILRRYPGTRASAEATRNIKVLKGRG